MSKIDSSVYNTHEDSYLDASRAEAAFPANGRLQLLFVLDQLWNANALEDELSNAVANGDLEVLGAEIEENNANIAAVV